MENIKGYLKDYKREAGKFYYDLEVGQIYQDLVMYTLAEVYKVSINPLIWSSRYFQMRLGEGMEGIEVKWANIEKNNGNVFIACYERGRKPTGIMSRSKYYAIGTDKYFYLFNTNKLREIYKGLKSGKKWKGFRYFKNDDVEGFIIDKSIMDNRAKEYTGTLEVEQPIKFNIFSPI